MLRREAPVRHSGWLDFAQRCQLMESVFGVMSLDASDEGDA